MILEVFKIQKEKKMIIQGIIIFTIFLVIYTVLDYFNGGYQLMRENYSVFLVVGNVLLNIVMSALSSLMMNLSTAFVRFSAKEGKGTFFTAFSVLFGLLTYGCTPCVIAFFSTIGLAFSVAVLPLAGLGYKFVSLALLIIGLLWLLAEIKRFRCNIKKVED